MKIQAKEEVSLYLGQFMALSNDLLADSTKSRLTLK